MKYKFYFFSEDKKVENIEELKVLRKTGIRRVSLSKQFCLKMFRTSIVIFDFPSTCFTFFRFICS